MRWMFNTCVIVLGLGMLLVLAPGAGAASALLADSACPDIKQEHHAARMRPGLLRVSSLGACYDIYVPAGSIGVISLKTLSGDPKSALAVRRYGHGLVGQDKGGTRQRVVFGELTASDWYQVRIDHDGVSGEVELHVYQVDVGEALIRGIWLGFGQAVAEEVTNALAYQLCLVFASAADCEAPAASQFRQAMVSRGVTLAVSGLQQRSLGQMTRDMALNEASILVRNQFGGGGGHMMTVVMAITSEIVSSIYAY